jgi:hypothetical protein
MAKKSRRAQRPAAKVAQPVRISPPSKRLVDTAPQEVDFSKEYHYVIEDLKRIGLTAAGLLILLIVLALVVG